LAVPLLLSLFLELACLNLMECTDQIDGSRRVQQPAQDACAIMQFCSLNSV